jgi:hypothetical protein
MNKSYEAKGNARNTQPNSNNNNYSNIPDIAMARRRKQRVYGPLTEKVTIHQDRVRARNARYKGRKQVTKTVVRQESFRKRPNPRKSKAYSNNNISSSLPEAQYAKCLNDPFHNAGIPLGLGTMVPTEVCEAFLRNVVTSASDGSFAIVLNPSAVRSTGSSTIASFVSADNVANTTTPTWANPFNATNLAALVADYDKVRIIAAGLRVFPVTAATATPGFVYAGLVLPTQSYYTTNNFTTVPGGTLFVDGLGVTNPNKSIMANFPSMEFSVGNQPIQVNWRPCQISDFQFSDYDNFNEVAGINSVNNQVPVLMIIGTGFPALSVIGFDAIVHLEGYNSQKSASTVNTGYDEKPTIVSRYPSIESLWNSTSKYLQPIVDYSAETIMTNLTEKLADYGSQRRIGFGGGSHRAIMPPMLHESKHSETRPTPHFSVDSDFDTPKEERKERVDDEKQQHPLSKSTISVLTNLLNNSKL